MYVEFKYLKKKMKLHGEWKGNVSSLDLLQETDKNK